VVVVVVFAVLLHLGGVAVAAAAQVRLLHLAAALVWAQEKDKQC
jgi:hypothetical protein